MDSSAVTLTEEDVGPLRDTGFAVLVNTLAREVCVLYILHININYSCKKVLKSINTFFATFSVTNVHTKSENDLG